jgi:hypothetical protein
VKQCCLRVTATHNFFEEVLRKPSGVMQTDLRLHGQDRSDTSAEHQALRDSREHPLLRRTFRRPAREKGNEVDAPLRVIVRVGQPLGEIPGVDPAAVRPVRLEKELAVPAVSQKLAVPAVSQKIERVDVFALKKPD